MRTLFPWLALAAAALMAFWTPRATVSADPGFKSISAQEAAARADFVVIDVREPFELAEELGKIERARNIPLGKIMAGPGWEGDLNKSAAILMVCRTGARSERAAARAAEMGFTNVYTLDGGMIAWNEAGLKVIKVKAEDKPKPSLQLNMVGIPCA